jgi:hypothetical protein
MKKESNLKFLIMLSIFCLLVLTFVKTLKPSKIEKDLKIEKIYTT